MGGGGGGDGGGSGGGGGGGGRGVVAVIVRIADHFLTSTFHPPVGQKPLSALC